VQEDDEVSERTRSELISETQRDEPIPSDADADEADLLEQRELVDADDFDDDEAIGDVDASEADFLDQARPSPLEDEEQQL
jgi:hypothetical protein